MSAGDSQYARCGGERYTTVGDGERTSQRLLAGATVALGIVLVAVDLPIRVLVSLAGVALILIGLADISRLLLRSGHARRSGLAAAFGALFVLAGAVILFWHAASVRTLMLVISGGLVLHGMRLIARGVRATSDERAAAFLVGAASVVLGGVCLSWPVLTIEIFALALGAWLFVIGLTGFFRTFVQNERAHERRVPRTRRWARTLLAAGGHSPLPSSWPWAARRC